MVVVVNTTSQHHKLLYTLDLFPSLHPSQLIHSSPARGTIEDYICFAGLRHRPRSKDPVSLRWSQEVDNKSHPCTPLHTWSYLPHSPTTSLYQYQDDAYLDFCFASSSPILHDGQYDHLVLFLGQPSSNIPYCSNPTASINVIWLLRS